ncbi:hypothetical protein BD408DRAFT_269267 [Parasitella parasitica]|nr:hypothetical protein BD408DRAFT_269267 [Parasitella parasitica]
MLYESNQQQRDMDIDDETFNQSDERTENPLNHQNMCTKSISDTVSIIKDFSVIGRDDRLLDNYHIDHKNNYSQGLHQINHNSSSKTSMTQPSECKEDFIDKISAANDSHLNSKENVKPNRHLRKAGMKRRQQRYYAY